MSNTIWRFDFTVADDVALSIPHPARVLPHVAATSPTTLTVWAVVNPDAPAIPVSLAVVGTGNPLVGVTGEYVGTAVAQPFVWHVFDRTVR